MGEQAVFRIAGVRKTFGAVPVLQGVDLALKPGAVTILMGANGRREVDARAHTEWRVPAGCRNDHPRRPTFRTSNAPQERSGPAS